MDQFETFGINDEESDTNAREMRIQKIHSMQIQKIMTQHRTLESSRSSKRLQCQCDEGLMAYENCGMSLKILLTHYKEQDLDKLRKNYYRLLYDEIDDLAPHILQIKKDLNRTHPCNQFYQGEGQVVLERILQCVAKYDLKIGYVQGMNYMLAGLLYHSDESVAFWNFVVAYERLELRDIYMPSLPGLSKHQQIVELLIMSQEQQLYYHLIGNNVIFTVFCAPLFFSLFGMVVTLQEYAQFFYKLMQQKWIFAYKIIIRYFQVMKFTMLQMDGPELLMLLTKANHKVQTEELDEYFKCWQYVIRTADQVNLDQQFINKMLDNFDLDEQRFYLKQ